MQWGIGICKGDLAAVVRNQTIPRSITWLPLRHSLHFMADPFVFRSKKGNIILLYEEFSAEVNGTIVLLELDQQFNKLQEKTIYATGKHLSYPLITQKNGSVYVMPENHQQQKLSRFRLDEQTWEFTDETSLISGIPLLDATPLFHNSLYWLFATSGDGINDNNALHLYYAESEEGPYQAHAGNPVKNHLDGSRPAGSIIEYEGQLYRPTQNCGEYYGKSITMQRITELNTERFSEEPVFDIHPDPNGPFPSGLHTINSADGILVIDGIRFVFKPWLKFKMALRNKFKR